MQKIWCIVLLSLLASIHIAAAKKYTEVARCDTNEETQVEVCYGTDGKLLDGMAAEGDQSFLSSKQRRKIRKQVKDGTYSLGTQTYTLSRFRRGIKDGLSSEIDEYGYNKTTTNYRRGVKDGAYTEYYPENCRKIEAFYKNGLLNGKVTFYNDRGKKIGVARYNYGKLVSGYCIDEDKQKKVFTADFIQSQPENELVSCQ